MHCPLCYKKLLNKHRGLSACPDGHGTLATGKYLSDIEESPEVNEIKSSIAVDSAHQIICPHCSSEMHKVDYNNTNIIIDSCINCHFRWLDSGEITKIKNFKPRFNPSIKAEDLLLFVDLDDKIRQANKREIKEANPRLPLQGSYRAGAEVVAGISGDHRVRLAAITGQGLYGIVKGLVYSKTSRIITILTLLIIALAFLIIFWDYRDMLRNLEI
jgi:Zn-finger nucleic acid-binding protein